MTWHRVILGTVIATIESGSRPKGGATNDQGDIPSLGGENILTSGGITIEDVRRVSSTFHRLMKKGHLENGDVLINKDGAQTGKLGWYNNQGIGPACINEHLFLLRGIPERITQGYLYYILLSETGQSQIRTQISGSAQPGLKSDFVKGITADIPEAIDVQSKIAEILSTVDRAIEQTEALIAKHQRIKIGLMHDLLTRGIDEHGNLRSEETHVFKDSPLGRIPVEWDVKPLGAIAQVKGGKRLPTGHSYSQTDTGFRYLRVLDFFQREIEYYSLELLDERTFKVLQRYEIKPDELCVSIAGSLGYFALFRPPDGFATILTENAARVVPVSDVVPDCLCAILNSECVQAQIQAEKGTGGGVPKLALFRIKSLLIPFPIDRSEQERIRNALLSVRCVLDTELRGAEKLRLLKTALMQDLLTGKRRVTALLGPTE